LASALITSKASCADRFGRNPKLAWLKSASKIGSNTNFAAAITTRSPTVGIPSGLVCPGRPGLGICTRRNGAGRYVPASNRPARSSRKTRTPAGPPAATASTVTPSTPGAPLFAATSHHARHITSLRVSLS
jgi:hypothetical protein